MSRAPLTEAQLRDAAVQWLDGRSWRALWKVFKCHPKYLQAQAKRLGYMTPDTIRTCPTCREPQPLTQFTRPGAGGRDAIMHECNRCVTQQQERQQPVLPPEPLLDTEIERLRQESIIFARAHLEKAKAKLRAIQATLRREKTHDPR